jgi:hypothetical protein
MDLPNPNQLPDETREAALSKEDETNIQTFGQEFEKKWRQDREKLGTERHREMEKLWMEGRRPRGNKDSEARLEQILRDYPDTNRAGCAAYELGHHYVRDRSLDLAAKRQKAEEAWKMVGDRYRDSLCEFNEPANAMSKIGLSMWVYRYTDKAMARRLLEEVIAKHPGETDHLGQRVEDLAGTLLEDLK